MVEYVPGPNNGPLGVVHAHVGLVNAVVAGLPATWGGSKAPPPHMLLHSDLTGVGALPFSLACCARHLRLSITYAAVQATQALRGL